MSHRFIALPIALFAALNLAAFAGCAGSEATDDVGGGGADPSSSGGAVLPGASNNGDGDEDQDANAPKKDAGKDAKAEAAVDAGPPPPDPGTACAELDKIFPRTCGACGHQTAVCLADGDGGAGGHVSAYSTCEGETAGGCIPGEVVTEACGNCGTHVKTCTKYCAFSATACTGEPTNSCAAGTLAWTTAGCTNGVQGRSCAETCQWNNFTGACSAPDYAIKVAGNVNAISNAIIPLRSTTTSKRLLGTCNTGTVSATDKYSVAWVRVTNPTTKIAKVTAWNTVVTGGAMIDTVLTAYNAVPISDADIKACVKGAGDYCDTTKLTCTDTKLGSLATTNQVTIGAGATIVIGIHSSTTTGTAGQITEGPVGLSIRTDTLE